MCASTYGGKPRSNPRLSSPRCRWRRRLDAGLNVTQRPVLRDWEIEYGGASGAHAARRLEPSDLLVSVEDGDVVLRSARLQRRVIPSCASAMNPQWVSLPAARFLLSIADQRTAAFVGWTWGELSDAPVLPRLIHRRTILALRRWNVSAAEFAEIAAATNAAGFSRLQEWRLGRDLPRVVGFDHPKARLLVDFGNVLSVDAFLAAVKNLDMLRFVEAPGPEQSPVEGPDGHYAHELIVPFTLDRASAPRSRGRRIASPVSESRRRFQPGTEWLYANLYGPVSAADRVLVDRVGPLAHRLRQAGRHRSLVLHPLRRPRAAPACALPWPSQGSDHRGIARAARRDGAALAEGMLYRISLDTYEREVERYGGYDGVELMEEAAEPDSEAVIEILDIPRVLRSAGTWRSLASRVSMPTRGFRSRPGTHAASACAQPGRPLTAR